MKLSARQWIIYFTAWVPYTLSYIAVFASYDGNNISNAVTITLKNIIPAPLVGILVIYLCGKFAWNRHRSWYFFIAQLGLAILYALTWLGTVMLVFTVEASFQRGKFTPNYFTGYALQWQMFSGIMIYATIASVIYLLQIAQNLRIEEQRAARAETLYAQTQLFALRAQLNPHFLFNTLHSLMALTRYEPQSAEAGLEKLAEMLRYVLQEKNQKQSNLIRLEEELDFVSNYLSLEKLRFGERLKIENHIAADTLDCLIPAFTLQPLVENAVKHGVSLRQVGGLISIYAEKRKGYLELIVKNDYSALKMENPAQSNGMGLKLLQQQFETIYGNRAEFNIEKSDNDIFSVRLKLPLNATVRIES